MIIPTMPTEGIRIEIGSGEYPRLVDEGFLHTDIRYPLPHQELCFSLELLPFKDNTISMVAILHALEHIPWTKTLDVLQEIYRVLRKDGMLLVVTPNLLYVAQQLIKLSGSISQAIVSVLSVSTPQAFGGGEASEPIPKVLSVPTTIPKVSVGTVVGTDKKSWTEAQLSEWNLLIQDLYCNHIFKENSHKSGFIPEYMEKVFWEAGFSKVIVPRDRFSYNIEAWGIK